MNLEKQAQVQQEYQAGKRALERGDYHRSIKHLEAARTIAKQSSRLGGEIGIWLVTAYQAADRMAEAITLGEKLAQHPHRDVSQQSKRLVYILKAPKLKRPKEWMTEIPDLTQIAESKLEQRRGSGVSSSSPKTPPEKEIVPPDEIETKDNQFVWLALAATLLILCGLWFLA